MTPSYSELTVGEVEMKRYLFTALVGCSLTWACTSFSNEPRLAFDFTKLEVPVMLNSPTEPSPGTDQVFTTGLHRFYFSENDANATILGAYGPWGDYPVAPPLTNQLRQAWSPLPTILQITSWQISFIQEDTLILRKNAKLLTARFLRVDN